jgi:hypothetical protein
VGLQFRPSGKRGREGELVSGFETAAGGNAARNASERDRFVFQEIDQIVCGRFAFDIGGEGENDFRQRFLLDSIEQFLDPQIFRADVIERRDASAQGMIAAAEGARFLKRQNIGRLLDDAEKIGRTGSVGANVADSIGREVATQFASMNGFTRGRDGARDLLRLISARLHHPKRDALGRARANSGHLPQLRDQITQRRWIFGLPQSARLFLRRFGQMQREHLQAAQVELQGCIVFAIGSAGFLKFRIRLGPPFLAIKHNAIPK